MDFKEAKIKAKIEANKCNKIIMEIQENEDYYFFEAGLPNQHFFNDGAGSTFVRKKDGKVIPMRLWITEIQNLYYEFSKTAKTIYNYYDKEKNEKNPND